MNKHRLQSQVVISARYGENERDSILDRVIRKELSGDDTHEQSKCEPQVKSGSRASQ